MKKGQIIRIIAGFFDVLNDQKKEIRLRGSGKLRNSNIIPLVGDIVEYDESGFVHKVLDRKNFFTRPKIANIDQAIIVMSIKEPDFSNLLLDKFLLISESKEIEPIILITKIDLKFNYQKIVDDYLKMNYKIYFIDNNNPKTIENIKKANLFENKLSVFMGQSGVGKTSIINNLSDNNFLTQQISKSLNRGKHTTRVVQIIDWNSGQLIDTPGFSSFSIELDKKQIATGFKIFKENAFLCKFRSCLHYQENEKECKIKMMVNENKIPMQRYLNYLSFLKEILGENNEKN
ncbi:ribosome small subunit-dependent GTPase A [Mesomycoplasma lagogenitalium]|uniref:Small ribosomal subunit biogenesis GTPase RsgA n=1 Tax=Mesomycoplasma lagogenitalium TaxID=171286 RepID=A0ABY8LTH7_9BACT|nr:ribosome small subunit-dependent GTPase A [Mesomycoplasma lagogenitalium]WGI36542.1 ribosome small subunit-dependent GTPase A [Mesomycoplasma lagogenitalium]